MLHLKLPKGNYTATWTDVQTGNTLSTEKIAVTGNTYLLKSPPKANDKVLKIKRR